MVVGILLLVGLFITGVANAAPDMSRWEAKQYQALSAIGRNTSLA